MSAPPGPVAMETLRRGLRGGFGPALHVQLGSIIGDLAWCLAALLGLAPLAQIPWVRGLLAVVGVGVLIYLGSAGVREALNKTALPSIEAAPGLPGRSTGAFHSGMAISMANPMAVAYWLSVGGALVGTGVAGSTPGQTALFIAGFVAGTLAWAFLMAFAARWGNRFATPAIFRLVNLACGIALIGFGLALAGQALMTAL